MNIEISLQHPLFEPINRLTVSLHTHFILLDNHRELLWL
jgi:hypothetical protein